MREQKYQTYKNVAGIADSFIETLQVRQTARLIGAWRSPEDFNGFFGAVMEDVCKFIFVQPLRHRQTLATIGRKGEAASRRQMLQNLDALHPLRPELRKINFE